MTELTATTQAFVLHWGEMGMRWGINRTVAQIHALLYLSAKPLNAEDIVALLSIARSNVSNSLRELQGWGIVRRVHVMGDRRDHYESMTDVWAMFQIILDERKKREIDPTMAMLHKLLDEPSAVTKEVLVRERLTQMLSFFESMSGWYTQIRRLPTGAVIKFVKMGDRVRKLLSAS